LSFPLHPFAFACAKTDIPIMDRKSEQAKAIFWDNDGVLADTESLYFEANRQILAGVGIELDEKTFSDISLAQGKSVLDLARQKGFSESRIESLRLQRNSLYSELLRNHAEAMPGVEPVLRALHGKVKMGVVTSSNREHFDIIHSRTGFTEYFDFVLANGDYAVHKPAPDPYLAAIRLSGVEPSHCIAVEDSLRGLHSALSAGIRCFVIPHGLTKRQSFKGAAGVLNRISELPAAVFPGTV
jgi:HAD superfamily hydrolase (TIGR01509 family)